MQSDWALGNQELGMGQTENSVVPYSTCFPILLLSFKVCCFLSTSVVFHSKSVVFILILFFSF